MTTKNQKPDYSGYSDAQLVGILTDRDTEIKRQSELIEKIDKENKKLNRILSAYKIWAKKVHESLDVLETIK